jgi:hypothetical protein
MGEAHVVTLPDLGTIVVRRDFPGEPCVARFTNTSGGTLLLHGIVERNGNVSSGFADGEPILANGGSLLLAGTAIRPRASFGTWQISNVAVSRVAAITASAFFGLAGESSCKVTVQGTVRSLT